MTPATLAIASDFVKSGMKRAGVPLSHTLEAYLAITFARHIGRAIRVDRLTVRVSRALDSGAPCDAIRELADECLIACAFFEDRLRRGGSIRHYVGLGQATYDAASMTEQAYGFVHMRDVIASAAEERKAEAPVLIDRARAGSVTAREELARENVVVGPWGAAGNGLIWN